MSPSMFPQLCKCKSRQSFRTRSCSRKTIYPYLESRTVGQWSTQPCLSPQRILPPRSTQSKSTLQTWRTSPCRTARKCCRRLCFRDCKVRKLWRQPDCWCWFLRRVKRDWFVLLSCVNSISPPILPARQSSQSFFPPMLNFPTSHSLHS